MLTAAALAPVQAQDLAVGRLTGTVVDSSSGVLPGVVVSAASASGRTLSTMVTGGSGEFAFERLPVGAIDLVFHLDGFEDARVSVVVAAAGPLVIKQALQLKALTESVIVRADAPPPPPAPRPVLQPVPEHDPSAVCGPAKAEGIVVAAGTIRSGQNEAGRGLFGPGDELLIDGGANARIRVGDNYIVRRRFPTSLTDKKRKAIVGEHSSGLVQIVSVDDDVSTAMVVYGCDEMMAGDYLVRFEPAAPTLPEPAGVPSFDAAVRILFADAGQWVGITNRMLVIDRGALDGVEAGQRFTLFRRSRFGQAKPVIVGEAVVVAARRESATIRVERSTDVVMLGASGDWAAPQRPLRRASQ